MRTAHSFRPRRSTFARGAAAVTAAATLATACGGDDAPSADVDTSTTVAAPSATGPVTEATVAPTTSSSPTTAPPPTTAVPTTATPTTAPSTSVVPTTTPTTAPPTSAAPVTPVEASFPDIMRDTWRESEGDSVTADECRTDNEAVENFGRVLTIRADGFGYFETGGLLLEAHERTEVRFEATFDTTYADTPTEDRLVFELGDGSDVLTVTDAADGATIGRYVRCPAPTPLTADEAEAQIESLGEWAPDMTTYEPAAGLSAVEAVPPGAASAASPEQIFLFASGRYVGTPTPEFRIASSFERIDDSTLRLTYGHFAADDAFCCPSLEPWVVDVRWDGDSLVFDGELPPTDQGLG